MEKFTPKELDLTPLEDDEYFIRMKSYKEDQNYLGSIEKKFLISNYGRIYSLSSNMIMRTKTRDGRYMVSINATGVSDSLSVIRLVVYNFAYERYKSRSRANYYIIDESKPVSIDNITNRGPLKNYLTEDQKSIIRRCRELNMSAKAIADAHPTFPVNATMEYAYQFNTSKRKMVKQYKLDKALSSKFEDEISKITNNDLKHNRLSDLVKEICEKYKVEYSSTLYAKCYRYFCGNTDHIKLYIESSTTSLDDVGLK